MHEEREMMQDDDPQKIGVFFFFEMRDGNVYIKKEEIFFEQV